ncbi:hypothetical protein AB3S75_042718 [Citrus x aurantiifolia]
MQPRLARGMQQAVVRQTAHACEASCPRSRGRQRALATKEISPSSREEVGPGLHTRISPHSPLAGRAAQGREASCPRSRGRQRGLAAKPRTAPLRGTRSTRVCPGLFMPVGPSLAGPGREAAMPLSALLPLFHGGRMLQLASVMRETTTCEKRSEGLDFLRRRRIIF